MGRARVKNFARISALLVAVAALAPGTAYALGDWHHAWQTSDDWAGYTVPIQDVYQFPASIVWQPTSSYGYAVPVQSAYQFPASLVDQPGVVLPLAPPRPLYIPSGDHHVINR
jgi:hypothetical protein